MLLVKNSLTTLCFILVNVISIQAQNKESQVEFQVSYQEVLGSFVNVKDPGDTIEIKLNEEPAYLYTKLTRNNKNGMVDEYIFRITDGQISTGVYGKWRYSEVKILSVTSDTIKLSFDQLEQEYKRFDL